jgi:hypothetical protein
MNPPAMIWMKAGGVVLDASPKKYHSMAEIGSDKGRYGMIVRPFLCDVNIKGSLSI